MKLRFVRSAELANWPQVDQALWARAVDEDPLQPNGRGGGRKWRGHSQLFVRRAYGLWISWLDKEGLLVREVGPAERASRKVVRAYLKAMRAAGYADYTCAISLQGLGDALRVMAPDSDTSHIGRAAGRVAAFAKRARAIRPRIRPPAELYELGLQLMAEADRSDLSETRRAIAFRDGLIIALLIHRPLRIANFAAIDLTRHVVRGRRGIRLEFPPEEMKSARPYSCALPANLEAAFMRYIVESRSAFAARRTAVPSDALWLSHLGRPMKQNSVAQVVRQRVMAAFGTTMGPHFARYIVATAVAELAPDQISDVPAILGHASHETSERHYIHANALRAGRLFHEALVARTSRSRS